MRYTEYEKDVLNAKIATAFQRLRKEKHKSRVDFSKKLEEYTKAHDLKNLNINEAYVIKREKCETRYSIPDLLRMCNFFDVDIDFIIGKKKIKTDDEEALMKITNMSQATCERIYRASKAEIDVLDYLINNGFMDMLALVDKAIERRIFFEGSNGEPIGDVSVATADEMMQGRIQRISTDIERLLETYCTREIDSPDRINDILETHFKERGKENE